MSFFNWYRDKKEGKKVRENALNQAENSGEAIIPKKSLRNVGKYNFMTQKTETVEDKINQKVQERNQSVRGEIKKAKLNIGQRIGLEFKQGSRNKKATEAKNTPFWMKEDYKLKQEHGEEGANKILQQRRVDKLVNEEKFTEEEALNFIDATKQKKGYVDDIANLWHGYNHRRKKDKRLRNEWKAEFKTRIQEDINLVTDALIRIEDPKAYANWIQNGGNYGHYIERRKKQYAKYYQQNPEKYLERIAEDAADNEESLAHYQSFWKHNLEKTSLGATDFLVDTFGGAAQSVANIVSPDYNQNPLTKRIQKSRDLTQEVYDSLIDDQQKEIEASPEFTSTKRTEAQLLYGVMEFFPIFAATKAQRVKKLRSLGKFDEAEALVRGSFKSEIIPSTYASVAQSGLETIRENEDFQYFATSSLMNVGFDIAAEGLVSKFGSIFKKNGKIDPEGAAAFHVELSKLAKEDQIKVFEALKEADAMLADKKFQRLEADVSDREIEMAQKFDNFDEFKKSFTKQLHHGTPDGRFLEEYNPDSPIYAYDGSLIERDDSIFKMTHGDIKRGFEGQSPMFQKGAYYFSTNKRVANTYAKDKHPFDFQNSEPMVVQRFLEKGNFFEIDAKGQKWDQFEIDIEGKKYTGTREIEKYAREQGYEGIVVKDVIDPYSQGSQKGTNYAIFDPEKIHSEDRLKKIWEESRVQNSKSSNPETPEFKRWFGDSKVVDKTGNPLVVYHGSRNTFDTFDLSRLGKNGRMEGNGFYFTNDKSVATGYSQQGWSKGEEGKLFEVYLSIKKPMDIEQKKLTQKEVSDILKKVWDQDNDAFANYGESYYRQGRDGADSLAEYLVDIEESDLDVILDLYNTTGIDPQDLNDIVTAATGYDGIKSNGFDNLGKGGGDIYVAFNPNQIKSIDNTGSFSLENDNIYYQMREKLRKDGSLYGVSDGLDVISPEEAESIVRKYFTEEEVSVNFVDNIKTPEGQNALGFYRKDAITFAKNPDATTPEHEVVHAYLDMFSTKKQKESVLKQVKKKEGILDDLSAEEFLADEFVRYARTKQFSTKSQSVKSYLRRVWNQFLAVFGAEDKVLKLFNDIDTRKRPSNRFKADMEAKYQKYADPKESLKAVNDKIAKLEEKYSTVGKFEDGEVSSAKSLINKLKEESKDLEAIVNAKFTSDFGIHVSQKNINKILDAIENNASFSGSKKLNEISNKISNLEKTLGGRLKFDNVKNSTLKKNRNILDQKSNGEYRRLLKEQQKLRAQQTKQQNLLNSREFRQMSEFKDFFAYYDNARREVRQFEASISGLSSGVKGQSNLSAAKYYAQKEPLLQRKITAYEKNLDLIEELKDEFDTIIARSQRVGRKPVQGEKSLQQSQKTLRSNDQKLPSQEEPKKATSKNSTESSQQELINTSSSNSKAKKAGKVKLLNVDGKEFQLPKETWFQGVRRSLEDSNIRLATLNDEIQKITKGDIPEYVDIWAQKDMLPRVQSRMLEKMEVKRENFVKNLIEDDIRVEDLDEYVKALHAPERNAKMRELSIEEGRDVIESGSGMTDAEALEIIKRVEGSEKAEAFKKHAKVLRDQTNETLNFQVKEGLISKKEADQIRDIYEYYVPLQRDIEDAGFGLGTGQGLDIRGKEIKKATGSEDLRVVSPSAQIFQAAQKAQVRALKNNIGKSVINLQKEFPMLKGMFDVQKQKMIPKFNAKGEITGVNPTMKLADNVIGVKMDGQQYFVTIKDPLVARALKNNYSKPVANKFTKALRYAVSTWSSLTTRWSPEFMITNFQRDLSDALINARAADIDTKGLGRAILKDVPSSQKELWKFYRKGEEFASPEMREFFDLGGDTGHFWLEDVKRAEKSMIDIQAEFKNEGLQKVKNPIKKAGKFIDDLNSIVEMGTRYAFYKNAVKRGMSKTKAVQAAADLTVNFSRKGEMTGFLQMGYAFVNPAFQGTSKTIRSLVKSKKARKAAGGLFAMGFATRAIQDQLGDDSIPDWAKNRQIAFELPKSFPIMGGKQITLWNISYGYAPFFAMGANSYDFVAGKSTGEEALSNIVGTTATAFSPVGGGSIADFAPTITKPIVEIGLNKNFMGYQIHPERPYETFEGTRYDRHNRRTSENAKALSKFIYETTGRDIYPDDLDHLWDSYTSGAGKFISNTFDLAQKITNGEDVDAGEVPFVRKFVRDVRASSEFYKQLDRVKGIAGKREVPESMKNKFYHALDQAVENDVFDSERGTKYFREFIKAQYKIPSTTDLSSHQSIKDLNDGFRKMSKEERKRFLESYAPAHRKKYMKALDPERNNSQQLEKEYNDKKPMIDKIKKRSGNMIKQERPKRREIYDKMIDLGFNKSDFKEAGIEKIYTEFK